jgi:polyphosphate:AMP phosphotransferase
VFEKIQFKEEITKADFELSLNNIISDLVPLQYKFKSFKRPLIIIITGFYGSGVEDLINFISQYIDMRIVKVKTFWKKTFNKEKPHLCKFWEALPERGKTAIFIDSWYKEPIKKYTNKKIDSATFENQLLDIERLERMLVEDGAIILKFWLYISKSDLKNNLKKVRTNFGNFINTVIKPMRWNYKHYETFKIAVEKAIVTTDTSFARWNVMNAQARRYLKISVLKTLHETFRLAQQIIPSAESDVPKYINNIAPILKHLNQMKNMDRTEYEETLKELQRKIFEVSWGAYHKKKSTVVVFEGWDAAGKGGCIRRLTNAIDTRIYNIHQTSAPSDYEKRFHYLWRFWNKMPSKGFSAIFDRSWYGRVLVERVENFATFREWARAYEEINSFEEQLHHEDIIIIKFWLHITKDEQLRRFEEREKLPWKQYKITDEDWRNREKWEEYERCADEMFTRTSTTFAPWLIIPANNKHYARIEVLKNFYNTISSAIK